MAWRFVRKAELGTEETSRRLAIKKPSASMEANDCLYRGGLIAALILGLVRYASVEA